MTSVAIIVIIIIIITYIGFVFVFCMVLLYFLLFTSACFVIGLWAVKFASK
jgi:hypothetical protein